MDTECSLPPTDEAINVNLRAGPTCVYLVFASWRDYKDVYSLQNAVEIRPSGSREEREREREKFFFYANKKKETLR